MNQQGNVIWFSGLSGAGKTTLCKRLAPALEKLGYSVAVLDGDDLRLGLSCDLGFSDTDRAEQVRRTAHVAKILSTHVDFVLVALITPLEQHRQIARELVPGMTEIFVDAPLHVCETRDPKGLYQRARAGLIRGFTGIDATFEIPINPHFVCRTDQHSVSTSIRELTTFMLSASRTQSTVPATCCSGASSGRRPTIAVDFDGVIADYDGWISELTFGNPRQDVRLALQQLREKGWKIVIHTTRGASALATYLDSEQIPFDEVNCNSDYNSAGTKPVATVYWDDRALRYSGDAAADLRLILQFRTWNGRI